jgi:hypothetical protein
MRAKRKKKTFESKQNEDAQMSSELESDRAMVLNLESFGVGGAGYDETETEPPSSTSFTRSEDHVSGHSDCTFSA